MAAKYDADALKKMLAKGHAIKNANGDPSYPIADGEDLDNAIRAVGRGGSDHDAIRRHIIKRASALGLSSKIPDNWNSDGSMKGSTSADRAAFELRKRRRGSLLGKLERRSMPFARGNVEVRAKPDGTGGTNYTFEGYGAVFDAPFEMWDRWGDPYTELVAQGAFGRTLRAAPDVPFLIGHNDAGIPLARTRSGTMQLSQDKHGLHVVVPSMDGRNSEVRNLASAVERGDLDEMSIGFVTIEHDWDDPWETRYMLDLELNRGDVSAVALAANPATAGAMMTALPTEVLSRKAAAERRAADEIVDMSGAPDYNPVPHAFDPAAIPCTASASCADQGVMNSPDAKFCDQCGSPVPPAYAGNGAEVVDDSGVVEDIEGADVADAELLSHRRRELEFLTLIGA
jgi:HK97 family phage prohead protease